MTRHSDNEVRVLNQENHTHYYLEIRPERLTQFYNFMERNRCVATSTSKMPGVSGAAVIGLTAIFTVVPSRFPAESILIWLRDEQQAYCGGDFLNPTITVEEIELALAKFGQTVPLLRGNGEEI